MAGARPGRVRRSSCCRRRPVESCQSRREMLVQCTVDVMLVRFYGGVVTNFVSNYGLSLSSVESFGDFFLPLARAEDRNTKLFGGISLNVRSPGDSVLNTGFGTNSIVARGSKRDEESLLVTSVLAG